MWRIPAKTFHKIAVLFPIAMICAILVWSGLIYRHISIPREANTVLPQLKFALLAALPLCAWGLYAAWRIIRDTSDAPVSLRRMLSAGWWLRFDKKRRCFAAFERMIQHGDSQQRKQSASRKTATTRAITMDTLTSLEQRVEWPPLETEGTPWNVGLQSLLEDVLACKEYAHFIRYVRQVLDRLDALHAEGRLVPVDLSVPLTGGQPGERAYAVVGGLTVFGVDVKFLRRDWGMTVGVHLYSDMEAGQVVERLKEAVPRLQFETSRDAHLRTHGARLPIPEFADEDEAYPPYYLVLILQGEPEAPTHIACYPWSDASMR